MNVDEDMAEGGDGGGDGIDSKSRMLIKKGKVAVKCNRKIAKATTAIKRMRRR